MKQTEVLIIGAGPGGYTAAIKLAALGKKVLLVEKDKLGGECLNYGCIPSKALIAAAGLYHKVKKFQAMGLEVQGLNMDLAKLQSWKSNLVSNFNKGIHSLCKGNGVEVLAGEARFLSASQAEVKKTAGTDSGAPQTETVEFEKAIIVTGSRPIELPGFNLDAKTVLSSKEALELSQLPQRLVVIGGGVIGLEIGTFYAKLGSAVTIVEMTGGLLPGMEPELVTPVERSLKKLGVQIHLNSQALSWKETGAGLEVLLKTPEGEKTAQADKILLCVGRKPNTENLGLEAAGVELDPKGFIAVDENYRTSASGVHAIGDVTGGPFLAHRSSREAIVLAEALASGEACEPRGAVPLAVFTDPEIAAVGLSEKEAREKGLEIVTGKFPFMASGRALTTGESEGFVKVVAEKETGRLLGAAIVGPEASDLISEACLALRLKATVHDVASTIHPHPTLPESFMEAAEASLGQAIHILARGVKS